MLALSVVKFVTSNPWRSACLLAGLIIIGLYATIRIQSLRLERAIFSLNEKKAEMNKIVVDGIVQKRKIDIAADELTRLRKKQSKEAARFSELLKKWPNDCEGSAQSAATYLRARIK